MTVTSCSQTPHSPASSLSDTHCLRSARLLSEPSAPSGSSSCDAVMYEPPKERAALDAHAASERAQTTCIDGRGGGEGGAPL